eukprot:TRINITY_DN4786_c1_g1_i7.p1 TRINITY_DN4786_c1_g1~~TRINITY_DN4786_c1_g1_i7.p1  ORF type:complete len:639 (+),score=73.43 TRINITY_DN4786_c1_g1_i7:194-2110(+)
MASVIVSMSETPSSNRSTVLPTPSAPGARWAVCLALALTILTSQVLVRYLSEFKQFCDLSDIGNVPVRETFASTLKIFMPLFSAPWITGAMIAAFALNSHGYVTRSRMHNWSIVYALISFLTSWRYVFELGWRCGSSSKVVFANRCLYLVARWGGVASIATMLWLAVLKLMLLENVAPKCVRLCKALAGICIVACLILWPIMSTIGELTSYPVGLLAMVVSVNVVFVICFTVLYCLFAFVLEHSARLLLKEAAHADIHACDLDMLVRAARRSRWTAFMSLAASISTLGLVVLASFETTMPVVTFHRVFNYMYAIDIAINTLSIAILSDVLPLGNVHNERFEKSMEVASASARSLRRREIQSRLSQSVGASAGSALTLAALMEGSDPEDVLRDSISRFRCVSWDVLKHKPDVITTGLPLDAGGRGNDDLSVMSEPCVLGECDAFVSHSWHDCGDMKWQALTNWCEDFAQSRGRAPRLWLDKLCIKQSDIERDLRCLPIFLAGCNAIVALAGPTFPTRLWCCVELAIYRAMLDADSSRCEPIVLLLGKDDDETEALRQAWLRFEVAECECFRPEDRQNFFRVVASYPGGNDGFNRFIRRTAKTFRRSHDTTTTTTTTTRQESRPLEPEAAVDMYDFTERC